MTRRATVRIPLADKLIPLRRAAPGNFPDRPSQCRFDPRSSGGAALATKQALNRTRTTTSDDIRTTAGLRPGRLPPLLGVVGVPGA